MPRSTSARNSCQARLKWAFFARSGSWLSRIEALHRAAAVAAAGEDVEQHPVRDLEARAEPLGRRAHQPLERLEVPVGEVVLGRLALDDLLAVLRLLPEPAGSRSRAPGPGPPRSRCRRSPSCPARPAIWWKSRAERTAVFCPSNLHRREKSTVRIGTLIPTPSVSVPQMTLSRPACASCSTSTRYFGSSPAWWTPIPCLSHLRTVGAVRAREAETRDRGPDRVLLLARAEVEAREVLRAVGGVLLREVDDVDGRLALRGELVERLRERDLGVGVLERHRPLAGLHDGGRAARCAG